MTDYPIKPLVGLLVYFLILTFVVTITNNVSTDFSLDAEYNSSGGIYNESATSFTEYADNPRFESLRYQDIKMPRFNLERNLQPTPMVATGLIYNNETCESYEGFSWEVTNWLVSWLPGVSDSFGCTGILDIAYYIGDPPPENYSFREGGVCSMPNVTYDRNVAESLGCTWYSVELQQQLQQEELQQERDFNTIWGGLRKIATFDLDFNLDNTFLNFILNFVLIGLPGIVVIIYGIIIIRKLVGFT